ncbi:class V chitinase-like [Prosopis cineraria]|uniref:class V chitinase-like n=1 Tax=Prosopis cineraria TaxID=364024 RepID=UPI00240F9845|nr:class V chitinase-like [Prosopis cineraria]
MSLRISTCIIFLAFLFSPFHCEEWISVGFWFPGIPISEIESTLFTHLVFCFVSINTSSFETSLSPYISSFSNTVKAKNPSIKTLLSIRGQEGYNLMVRDASFRQIFIQSSFNVAKTYGFDGLDFYWDNQSVTQLDMNGMATFLQEWRKAANDINPELILTATVRYSPNYTESIMYPIESMEANLNWVHVKTFDYSTPSSSSKITAAPSALHDPSNGLDTEHFIRQWIDKGLPKSRVVMGLALYGFAWNLTDPDKDNANGIGTSANGVGETPHEWTGMITYKEIKARIQSSAGDVQYNATYVVNYWSQGSTWIGFDDVEAVREMVSFAKRNKLLGYFLWQISNDDNWQLSLAGHFSHILLANTLLFF